MTTDRAPGIDWAALSQEADDAYDNAHPSWSHAERCQESARAVVAAYRDQQRARGVVEVRADDLAFALERFEDEVLPDALVAHIARLYDAQHSVC
jgi:hypothetical protein